MSDASELELLRARAALLARPPLPLEVPHMGRELLVFARRGQRFGIDLRFVRAIVALQQNAELPLSPPACLGLGSARGELYALFDLTLLAEAPNAPLAAPKLMLVCGEGADQLAIAVDQAGEILEAGVTLSQTDSQASPFAGLDPRGFLVIDGPILLSDPRLRLEPKAQESFL